MHAGAREHALSGPARFLKLLRRERLFLTVRLRQRNQDARKGPAPLQAHQAALRGLTPVPLGTDAHSATRGGWRRSDRRHGGEEHGEGVGDRAPQSRRHDRRRIDGNG